MKSMLKRHGWFILVVLAWLVLARLQPGADLASGSGSIANLADDRSAGVASVETPGRPAGPTATTTPTTATATAPAVTSTPSPSPQPSPTPTRSPTLSLSSTSTPLPSVTAPAQSELVALPEASSTLVPTEPAPEPSPTTEVPPAEPSPTTEASPANAPGHPYVQPFVLANYYPWYDPGTWSSGCSSGSDQPQAGAYNSDDGGVIARHLAEAQQAGVDGFAVHWYTRGNRTDVNLAQVLNSSPGGFGSTVLFLCHIVGCANQQTVIDQLAYIINTYGSHPGYRRIDGKPVILFSDMARVPGSGYTHAGAIDVWGRIRNAVDPQHATWWIAEGLEPGYLQVFDGLYVYKIDHACCPNAAAKAPAWADWVRTWEQQTGQPKLWVGTVSPGWNDLNSTSSACNGPDSRAGVISFGRDRENGAYYNRTWEYVLPTQPDFIVVNSFNEWIEGSYIEPSAQYGDLYLQLTAAGAARFKSSR